jgi:hypothetical protein
MDHKTSNHFFTEAPVLPWQTWIYRKLFTTTPIEPTILQVSKATCINPPSPTGVLPICIKATHAKQYSQFLANHYYPNTSQVQLIVPSCIIESGIKNKFIDGIELRDTQNKLVGTVFCFYTGLYQQTHTTGLITWLCIHPSWRKKGVSNCLLRSIYSTFQPRSIYFFRNDGLLKSTIPPIVTEFRIQRKKPYVYTKDSTTVQRVPYTKWSLQLKQSWKQSNPTGILLEDTAFQHRLLETWEYKINSTDYCIIFLYPTFECQREQKNPLEQWCEVITWLFIGSIKTTYEQSYCIERLLDVTSYAWFDAPNTMPHIESRWNPGGYSHWSVLGLDVGNPVMRPVLSLCAN